MIASAAVLAVEAAAPALQPFPSDDRVASSARSAANEFFAAQDETLQTGDVRRLIAAVAPTFVDHLPGATGHNRAGLIEDVLALRTALSGVLITAEVFLVEGDKALVYVSLRPGSVSGISALSTPAPNVASADTIEMVHVTGGVVA